MSHWCHIEPVPCKVLLYHDMALVFRLSDVLLCPTWLTFPVSRWPPYWIKQSIRCFLTFFQTFPISVHWAVYWVSTRNSREFPTSLLVPSIMHQPPMADLTPWSLERWNQCISRPWPVTYRDHGIDDFTVEPALPFRYPTFPYCDCKKHSHAFRNWMDFVLTRGHGHFRKRKRWRKTGHRPLRLGKF